MRLLIGIEWLSAEEAVFVVVIILRLRIVWKQYIPQSMVVCHRGRGHRVEGWYIVSGVGVGCGGVGVGQQIIHPNSTILHILEVSWGATTWLWETVHIIFIGVIDVSFSDESTHCVGAAEG